jgi:AraC-like DNA-binding protein
MTADRRHAVDRRRTAAAPLRSDCTTRRARCRTRPCRDGGRGTAGHPAEPWTLDSLANEVHLSRSQLVRAFGTVTSLGPMGYLRLMRLSRWPDS